MEEKVEHRLPILFGTMLCQLGLGTLYTWSLFNQPLGVLHHWSIESVALCFSIATLALAIGTLFSGTLQHRFGARKVSIVCGAIMGIGLIVAPLIPSYFLFYLSAGLVVGMANGIAYMMTLTNAILWYPEAKGLISGASVACYGLGSLLFKYINADYLEHFGVVGAFMGWGVSAMAIIILGGFLIKDAPVLEETVDYNHLDYREYTRRDLFSSPQAWLLFIAFTASCLGGLYMIGVAKDIGITLGGLTPAKASTSVAVLAIANSLGRFTLGTLSDHMERTKVSAFAFAFILASVVVLLYVPLTYMWFLFAVGGIAFAFGGNLSIWPTIVAEYFGLHNSTKNYGIIYQGFGLGGILGGFIANALHNLIATFYVVLVLTVIAFVIMIFIHPERKQRVKE